MQFEITYVWYSVEQLHMQSIIQIKTVINSFTHILHDAQKGEHDTYLYRGQKIQERRS